LAASLAVRATTSLALLIGFYLFAIGVAGALLAIAYFVGYESVNHGTAAAFKLVIACVGGAVIILWSILPRFDRFEPPGLRLRSEDQPELFQMIDELSAATREAVPAEVYLTGEVNAFVAQRGGIMGIGSRRVMGLGLTLMRVLTVPQLRAVLAHEFGHYYGGDTRLGPVVYNMRGAIFRTVVNLARHDSILSILHKPFDWYGAGALRITQGVSRSQEYAADQLAARTVGAKALADGLRIIHDASAAYIPFLKDELGPVLKLGARPPFADGFAQFLAKPHVATAVGSALEQEIAEGSGTPYDSHPPLRERLAQLDGLPPTREGEAENDASAVSLLRNLKALEAELLIHLTGDAKIKAFRTASWEDVRTEVYLPAWHGTLANHAADLQGLRPADFPRIVLDLVSFGRKFAPRNELPPTNALKQRGAHMLGAALAYSLYAHGWKLLPETEEFCRFQTGAWILDPFAATTKLVNGELQPEEWDRQCHEMGIANWDLGDIEKLRPAS